MAEASKVNGRLDLEQPRWDQSTYLGRAKHFFSVTDPRTIFASSEELENAKRLVELYKEKKEPAGTTNEQLWRAKQLRDSAFHPDTGEKNPIIGRMSFQVPGNMLISGCMMTFYRTVPAIVFWQWVNQTFNCIVNYTNRNASAEITPTQLGQAYVLACTASVGVGLGLNRLVGMRPALAQGLVGRLVPFVAVAAANCVNIPMMRQVELRHGITVRTSDGQEVGSSVAAAKGAVGQVIPSRIIMAMPGMIIPSIVMNRVSRTPLLRRMPFLAMPLTVALCGVCLTFSTPLCCALFPQKSALSVDQLEPELQKRVLVLQAKTGLEYSVVYYNKGL